MISNNYTLRYMQIKNICSGDECGDIECKINGDGCAIYDTE